MKIKSVCLSLISFLSVLQAVSMRPNMNDIEIEIKVSLKDPKPLLEFLHVQGKFQAEKHQIDEYFSPKHKGFLEVRPVAEWLRLRDADGVCSINYKNWHYDQHGKSSYCDEFETSIGSIEKGRKILAALGFQSIVVVDKVRKTWVYQDYEIAMDTVAKLGDFVEIEYIGNDSHADPNKITQDMMDFLKNIGCNDITQNYVGYPFLLLFPKK